MNTSPKKPSPLSQSTPSRASPFRRPESPMTTSPATVRPADSVTARASPASPSTWAARSPNARPSAPATVQSRAGGTDPLSRLHPAQLREMRESFQTLDRDNDGSVHKDDVKEMLDQIGASTRPSCSHAPTANFSQAPAPAPPTSPPSSPPPIPSISPHT